MLIRFNVIGFGSQDGNDASRNELVQDDAHVTFVSSLIMGAHLDDDEGGFMDAQFALERRFIWCAGEFVLMPLSPEQCAGGRTGAHGVLPFRLAR